MLFREELAQVPHSLCSSRWCDWRINKNIDGSFFEDGFLLSGCNRKGKLFNGTAKFNAGGSLPCRPLLMSFIGFELCMRLGELTSVPRRLEFKSTSPHWKLSTSNYCARYPRVCQNRGEGGGSILPPSQPIPLQSHQSSNPTKLSAVIPRVFHHPPAEQATRQRTPAEDFLIFFFKWTGHQVTNFSHQYLMTLPGIPPSGANYRKSLSQPKVVRHICSKLLCISNFAFPQTSNVLCRA